MPYPETIKYIKKQVEEGISIDKIKEKLVESGYQEEVIEQLIEKAGVLKTEKKSEGIEKIIFKDAAISVAILLLVGSLVYFNFLKEPEQEFYAPPRTNTGEITLDFSTLSPLELEKGKSITIDLNKHVSDKNYKINELTWWYGGKLCINIKISENKAILRSIFLKGCPEEENILFEATNPEGNAASDTLKIRIIK